MENLIDIKTLSDDNFEVEYEASCIKSEDNIDFMISETESEIEKINSEIDRLTNRADNVDYITAVCCGIITGLIDSFFWRMGF